MRQIQIQRFYSMDMICEFGQSKREEEDESMNVWIVSNIHVHSANFDIISGVICCFRYDVVT